MPIQALVYVLANIDPAIFAGNPQSLLGLGDNLLEKLNPSQRDFKQADYPSARASIEALFQALFLAKEVAPRYLNLQDSLSLNLLCPEEFIGITAPLKIVC